MKLSTITEIVLMLLVSASALPAQQSNQPVLPLAGLKAPEWEQRWRAYENIKAHPENLKRRDVKDALMGLFELENGVVRQTLAESNGEKGVSDKYGEGYSEYYAQLTATVESVADWHDPHQLCILAEGAYSPGSDYAAHLVTEGGAAAVPCLLKTAHGDLYERYQSLPTLIQLYAVARDLSPAQRQEILQLLTTGIRDPIVLVREPAIQAMGKYGTPDMIPLLEEVARSDPYSRLLENGQILFEVRNEATKAIGSIRARQQAPSRNQ